MKQSKRYYEFGPFRIERNERLLRRGQDVVGLPPKAIDVLLALLERGGEAVPKEELLSQVWPGTFVEEGSLAQNISVLRKALRDQTGSHYIDNLPRRGYRFVAPIASTAGEPGAPRSIAILPLANLSGDATRDVFAEGMTAELIGRLMKIAALRVAPRTSVMAYRGLSKPLREIARELEVDWVVEGAVLQSSHKVRITVHLIEGATERQLWAEAYERDLCDVLALQSDIVSEVARQIRVSVTAPEQRRLTTSRPVDPDAYDAYLRGRHFLDRRVREGLTRAVDYFRTAIDRDPTYAPALAGLADAYALLGTVGYDVLPPHDAMPRARAAAGRAVELDPTMAPAHASLGYIALSYEWDGTSAERHFQRSFGLDPSYATAHLWYGHYLFARHRLEDAIRAMRRAVELDPLSVPCNLGIGWSLYYARRFDDAIAHYRKTLEIGPDPPMVLYELGLSHQNQGQFDEALAVYRRGYDLSRGEAASVMLLAHLFALMGRHTDARRHLGELEDLSRRQFVPSLYMAFVHVGLGNRDEAFAWFDKAYEERSNYLVFLGVEPALDSVRSDPRFVRLMRRIGVSTSQQRGLSTRRSSTALPRGERR